MGGGAMDAGECADPGGTPSDQLLGQPLVDDFCIFHIREPGLGGEGIGLEPFQQLQIHTQAQHGELGGVQVHITEARGNDRVPIIYHLAAPMGWKSVQHAFHQAVPGDDIARGKGGELTQGGRIDQVTADGAQPLHGFHKTTSFKTRNKWIKEWKLVCREKKWCRWQNAPARIGPLPGNNG